MAVLNSCDVLAGFEQYSSTHLHETEPIRFYDFRKDSPKRKRTALSRRVRNGKIPSTGTELGRGTGPIENGKRSCGLRVAQGR